MEHLTDADYQRLLSFLLSLGDLCDAETFLARASAELRTLIPCDMTAYNTVDTRNRLVTGSLNPPEALMPDAADIMASHLDEHPLIQHYAHTGDESPIKLSDFLSQRQLHDLGIFQELYRRLGVEHQMSVSLATGSSVVIGLTVNAAGRTSTSEIGLSWRSSVLT